MASAARRRSAMRWLRYTSRQPAAKVTGGAWKAARRLGQRNWHTQHRLARIRMAIAVLTVEYSGVDNLVAALMDDQRWSTPSPSSAGGDFRG